MIETALPSSSANSRWPHVFIRRLLVMIVAALLIWGAVVVGISGIARAGNPELALWASPTDSRALSNLADRLLIEKQSLENLDRSKQLARAALLNDPTNVAALRLLGFAASQKDQFAIFELSNRLSRRDLATQLWLIDYHVGREDAASALAHYDAALRTSSVAPQLLFPVLAKASGDETLAPQIASILAKKPGWAMPFLNDLLFSSPSPDTLLTIFKRVGQSGTKMPQTLTDGLIARTLRDHRFDLTREAYTVAGGTDRSIGMSVKNGNFASDPAVLPFDWTFSSDQNIYAGRSPSETVANDLRMVVQVSGGHAGEAVRQLLLLSPGRYSLSSTAGSVPMPKQALLTWRLTCASKTGIRFHEMQLPPSVDAGGASMSEFNVPNADCPAQWLSLQVTTQTDSEELVAWVDNVAVKRLK